MLLITNVTGSHDKIVFKYLMPYACGIFCVMIRKFVFFCVHTSQVFLLYIGVSNWFEILSNKICSELLPEIRTNSRKIIRMNFQMRKEEEDLIIEYFTRARSTSLSSVFIDFKIKNISGLPFRCWHLRIMNEGVFPLFSPK